MTPRTLSIEAVRLLAIQAQGLDAPKPATPSGLTEAFRALRAVQLDPISAAAKSHQHVLRCRTEHPSLRALNADLNTLLWRDRSLFEYWAHCASIVLTEDFPIHEHRMRNALRPDATDAWSVRSRAWMAANAKLRARILREIKTRGPLPASAIEDESEAAWSSSGWNNGRTVSQMLDLLWFDGTLMVSGRKGNSRIWDLAERHLPAETPRERLRDAQVTRQAALHAVRALGAGTQQHIKQHFTRGRYPDLQKQLQALVRAGEIAETTVTGLPDIWYAPADVIDGFATTDVRAALDSLPTRMLSPFDNLICDRKRTEQLFGMDFRIEIYVPPDKRKYGYYVLPVMHRGRFIGRVDPKFDKVSTVLSVPRIHLELGAPKDARRVIGAALEALGDWLGAKQMTLSSAA